MKALKITKRIGRGRFLVLTLSAGFALSAQSPVATVSVADQAAMQAAQPERGPAAPPKISYAHEQLTIEVAGSSLAEILEKVAALTGVKIEIPEGARSEKLFVTLGPGPAREVLSSLLAESNFDFLIQASDLNAEKIASMLVMPREKKSSSPMQSEVAARSRSPFARGQARMEEPPPPPPEPVQAEVTVASVAPAAPDPSPAEPASQPQDALPTAPSAPLQPVTQPAGTLNGARIAPVSLPTSLDSQSISQQLQQMYQQRVQLNQQASPQLPPKPGGE